MTSHLITDLGQLDTDSSKLIQQTLASGESPAIIITDVFGDNAGRGILVLTEQRIIYVEKLDVRWSDIHNTLSGKPEIIITPLTSIVQIDKEKELLLGTKIILTLTEDHWSFTVAHNDDLADQICNHLQKSLVKPSTGVISPLVAPSSPSIASTGNISERLEELAKLHDSGQINDEEYLAKRKQLIDQI